MLCVGSQNGSFDYDNKFSVKWFGFSSFQEIKSQMEASHCTDFVESFIDISSLSYEFSQIVLLVWYLLHQNKSYSGDVFIWKYFVKWFFCFFKSCHLLII